MHIKNIIDCMRITFSHKVFLVWPISGSNLLKDDRDLDPHRISRIYFLIFHKYFVTITQKGDNTEHHIYLLLELLAAGEGKVHSQTLLIYSRI